MKLSVTDAAIQCFLREWSFQEGDSVRIFVRYSGGGSDAFAFGIIKEDIHNAAIVQEVGGLTFFITDNDLWYWQDQDLTIDYVNEEIRLVRE